MCGHKDVSEDPESESESSASSGSSGHGSGDLQGGREEAREGRRTDDRKRDVHNCETRSADGQKLALCHADADEATQCERLVCRLGPPCGYCDDATTRLSVSQCRENGVANGE